MKRQRLEPYVYEPPLVRRIMFAASINDLPALAVAFDELKYRLEMASSELEHEVWVGLGRAADANPAQRDHLFRQRAWLFNANGVRREDRIAELHFLLGNIWDSYRHAVEGRVNDYEITRLVNAVDRVSAQNERETPMWKIANENAILFSKVAEDAREGTDINSGATA